MPLTKEQYSFIEKYLGGGLLSKRSDAKKISDYEAFLAAETLYFEARKRVPDGSDGKAEVIKDHAAAMAYRDKGKVDKARSAMDRVLAAMVGVEQRIIDTKATLLKDSNGLKLAGDAIKSERDFFEAARTAVAAALTDRLPTPDKLATARKELQKAALIAARTGKLKDLHDRNPKAAAAAHLAFESMRDKTGGGEITPERISDAEEESAKASADALRHDADMRRAEALPVNNIDEGIARMQAIVDARNAKAAAEKKAKEAKDLANALLGTKLLSEQLEKGPLSGKGDARKMPDDAIEALISSFTQHPRTAELAVEIANTALDPVAVAKAASKVGAQADAGFKSADGKAPDGFDPQDYARKVLSMGGTCGADYFDRLDDYVRLGGLMEDAPLPDSPTDTRSARGQKRSVAVAAQLLDDTGALALDTDEAKSAIGHMLFHPDAMATPTPALNKHVLETLNFLGKEPGKSQAEGILIPITPPTPGQSGASLVNASLGKTGAPTDKDVRQVVMASMLQSVDQGPVGSCFATAPTRRMRETDPIGAMKKYTELAVNGTFTSASGTVVPAVTNLPPGEDPLIRSMEYTLATAMSRDDTMNLRKDSVIVQTNACVALQTEVTTTFTAGKDSSAVDFLDALAAEFTATYDPLIPNDGKSADDSSDRGRYVFSAKDGTRITTRDEYEAKAKEVALAAYGETADTDNGKAILAAVSGTFMSSLDGVEEPPWKLASGGETADAAKTLSGLNTDTSMTAKNATKSTTPAEIGTRTRAVLENLVGGFGATPSDMVVVKTQSMHGFNALPNHPSMAELMSGPGTTAEKITAKLLDAGKDLAKKKLDPATAQEEYDSRIAVFVKVLEDETNDASLSKKDRKQSASQLKKINKLTAKHRPAVASTMDEIITAVGISVAPSFNKAGVEADMRNEMTAKYVSPQIVIADTNWGSGDDHKFFVIAPDPRSGEPMLWQKTDPPGSMVLLDSKWIDDEWRMVT